MEKFTIIFIHAVFFVEKLHLLIELLLDFNINSSAFCESSAVILQPVPAFRFPTISAPISYRYSLLFAGPE